VTFAVFSAVAHISRTLKTLFKLGGSQLHVGVFHALERRLPIVEREPHDAARITTRRKIRCQVDAVEVHLQATFVPPGTLPVDSAVHTRVAIMVAIFGRELLTFVVDQAVLYTQLVRPNWSRLKCMVVNLPKSPVNYWLISTKGIHRSIDRSIDGSIDPSIHP